MSTDTTTDVKNTLTADEAPTEQTPEEFYAQVQAAQKDADGLQASITQREWLLIRRALDLPREHILTEGGIRLVALAWVKASRERGGASWDQFLNMTDDQIMELHGFPTTAPTGIDPHALVPSEHASAATTREEADAKAAFCLRLGIAPSDYDDLTDLERLAFRDEAQKIRAEQADG